VQVSADNPASEISLIASHSPSDAAAEPASITSTPIEESFSAISSFSCGPSETPGVCSPSRKVVSKKRSFSANKTICHGYSTTIKRWWFAIFIVFFHKDVFRTGSGKRTLSKSSD
jgi:hypothetical protein